MTTVRIETKSRGFTLIEILVVIIVLGLLAALVGPRILGRVSEAKTATARTQIELLGLALDNYRLDNGSYPTRDRKSTRLNSSHGYISYAVFCLKKKKKNEAQVYIKHSYTSK